MKTKLDEQIEDKLDAISEELEGANRHDSVELPRDIYNGIKHLVGKDDRTELANRICAAFYETL